MPKKMFKLAIVVALLAGCSSPQSFKAAGEHNNTRYQIEVRRQAGSLSVSMNNVEALKVERVNMHLDPNCRKTNISSWVCSYTTSFEGMSLRVVEETNTTLISNSLYYDIYLDEDYVQRVVAQLI